jgi:acyl-CoA synthetase (NDP forming)
MKRTGKLEGWHESNFDIDDLLHPAQAFEHPRFIVSDPDLTLNEKRAILSSWASDACAIEAAPALRQRPGTVAAVSFDEIVDALRALDRQAREDQPPRHYRKVLADRKPGIFGRWRNRSTPPEGEGQAHI